MKETGTFGRRRQRGKESFGMEQLERMRVEGQNDSRAFDASGEAANLGDQGGMTTMNAVEIAYGNRSASTAIGGCLLPIKRVQTHAVILAGESAAVHHVGEAARFATSLAKQAASPAG